MNIITHPITHNKVSIYSDEGIKLLKAYISFFFKLKHKTMTGGADTSTSNGIYEMIGGGKPHVANLKKINLFPENSEIEAYLNPVYGFLFAELAIDNYYSITSDSNYYQILYPNGGEMLYSGTECQITWNVGGDVGEGGGLYYSIYGGESWYLIDYSGSSPYSWTVPQIQGSSDVCRIKIKGSREDWFDISDADFTISGN